MLPAQFRPLYLALPRSRDEATSIGALALKLAIDEREVRDQIKVLRELYHLAVIALPTRNGVWLSNDPADVDALIACQTARARSIEHSVKVLKQVRDRMAYSTSLF